MSSQVLAEIFARKFSQRMEAKETDFSNKSYVSALRSIYLNILFANYTIMCRGQNDEASHSGPN